MNALNVLFFGLLLAVLCGVYLSLNRSPEPTLPPGLDGNTTPPTIDIGKQMGPPVTNIPSPASSNPPSLPTQAPPTNNGFPALGGTAPPYTTGPASMPPPWPSQSDSSALPPPPPTPPTPPPGDGNPFNRQNSLPQPPLAISQNTLPPPAERPSSPNLDLIMQQVDQKVKENRFANALLILSQLYGSPDLSPSQTREVTLLLDQLGAKVIYSREYWLGSPYLVQAGDTLKSIGDRYQIPGLLLAKINGICGPRRLEPGQEPEVVTQELPPGKELKVFKGPFSAQISTDHSEMTLMLDGRYAGRFNVVLSNDLSHAWGMYTVRDQRPPAAVPGNGTGKQWIELGNASGNISMQGTNDTRVTADSRSRSTIWLSEQDMDNVFGILSVGSRVIIQR